MSFTELQVSMLECVLESEWNPLKDFKELSEGM